MYLWWCSLKENMVSLGTYTAVLSRSTVRPIQKSVSCLEIWMHTMHKVKTKIPLRFIDSICLTGTNYTHHIPQQDTFCFGGDWHQVTVFLLAVLTSLFHWHPGIYNLVLISIPFQPLVWGPVVGCVHETGPGGLIESYWILLKAKGFIHVFLWPLIRP